MQFDLWSRVMRAASADPTPSPTPAVVDPPAPAAQDPAPSPTEPPAPLIGGEPAPADPAKPADEPKPGDEPKAPDAFDATKLAAPEGVELDPALMEDFGKVATEYGLSQPAAQALLDLHSKVLKEAAVAPYQLWAKTQTEWQDTIKADPEIGGDKLDANLAKVSKVLDQYGTKELRQALAYTGAGNNPEIARFMVKMANVLVEGGHVNGGGPGGGGPGGKPPVGPGAMYPNLPQG